MKTPFWKGVKKRKKNTLNGRALVRIRAKIQLNTLCCRTFVRLRQKREKKTLSGSALVRIRAKLEKKGYGKNKGKIEK